MKIVFSCSLSFCVLFPLSFKQRFILDTTIDLFIFVVIMQQRIATADNSQLQQAVGNIQTQQHVEQKSNIIQTNGNY